MGSKLFWGAVALVLSWSWPAVASPSLMACGGDATYADDTTSGDLTVLADPAWTAASPELVALATDPRSGTVYGIDLAATPIVLLRFDAAGQVESSLPVTHAGQEVSLAEALAFAPDGRLYVSFRLSDDGERPYQSGHLGVLDPASGAIDPGSVVALSGGAQDDGDALELVHGTLYLVDTVATIGAWLYTVDVQTGALTEVGELRGDGAALGITDLAWDGQSLWAEGFAIADPSQGKLVVIDPATAAATLVGPTTARAVMDGLTVVQGTGGDPDDDGDDDDDGDRRRHRHHHHHHERAHHGDCR